jgi:transposase-like protein
MDGQTIDFFLSVQRDVAAAKQFLQRAIEQCCVPQEEGALPSTLLVRTERYLNNVIEQDHPR